jgi:hypothetical protein
MKMETNSFWNIWWSGWILGAIWGVYVATLYRFTKRKVTMPDEKWKPVIQESGGPFGYSNGIGSLLHSNMEQQGAEKDAPSKNTPEDAPKP